MLLLFSVYMFFYSINGSPLPSDILEKEGYFSMLNVYDLKYHRYIPSTSLFNKHSYK